jgi:transposase
MSRSSLHRRLNAHALRPYRHKYFLQISDPFFFEKMEKIIQAYADKHKYLFCLDECTGLQALERIAPTLPADGKKPAYQEPEYKRHGTVSLLSVLWVSTGRVFTECIDDHTSATVIGATRKHAMLFDKSAELHYICDNYSSHSTEEFCAGIADLCGVTLPVLKTVEQRRQWLESTDKRIVFHFLPTHGSWLNLIEIWFGILQQKALKHESFCSTDELCERIMDFTDTWCSHLAHPFNWTYTGQGLHEKVVGRFIKWLQIESPQLNAKFLGKQLVLMSNLARKYWSKAKTRSWQDLKTTLSEKNNYLLNIIGTDETHTSLLSDLHDMLNNNLEVH